MKRILVLNADYDYRHRSAANAIAEALQETYGNDCQMEIVNQMDDPHTPAVLPDGEGARVPVAWYRQIYAHRPSVPLGDFLDSSLFHLRNLWITIGKNFSG